MHRDKPPGLFDFTARSIRYLIGFWFATGLLLSVLVYSGMLVWRVNAKEPDLKPNPEALEAATAAQRAAAGKTPPPDGPAAVRY